MQRVVEAGGDAEVAAAAAQPPEQIAVLALGGADQPAVGGDEIDRRDVVAGPAEPARQVAEAAAEREPRAAGGRDEAEHGGQAVHLRLAVDVAEQAPGLRARQPLPRVDPHAAHQRHVEHQAAVAAPPARRCCGRRP